jgi:hypothetical protein
LTKLDLDLINQRGFGRPVPAEMDSHIIKYVTLQRKEAVSRDPNLLTVERWDHSDVFYYARTHLNQLGWDTSVYNDNTEGGSVRRKRFYGKIKDICENYHGKKRHEIGIYPDDRAVMTFSGQQYTVGFDSLRSLMSRGTDVVFVEKQGTVIKMLPFAEKVGLAFIDSQGFGSEYGVALARLSDQQIEAARSYTRDNSGKYYTPICRAHLANLTDCDASGVGIGIKITGATRIGIDLDSIQEINDVNRGLGLGLEIEDLQEDVDNTSNSHFKGLLGILSNKGKLYDSLAKTQVVHYQKFLNKKHVIDGEEIRFIDWLETKRIELNTILSAAKPIALWNWIKWKLTDIWPERDYNRAIFLGTHLYTPTMQEFIERYQEHSKSVVSVRVIDKMDELSKTEGFIEDVESEQEEIENDLIDNALLKDDKTQKIDLALKSIMKKEVSAA